MGKTHYCSIDRANESDNNDYYGTAACGLEYFENGDDDIKYVTCKNCLRVVAKSNKKAKATLPKHIVRHSAFKECEPNRHKARDNAFGVTWCVKCGRLFTKPCGKPLQESDKIVVHCA